MRTIEDTNINPISAYQSTFNYWPLGEETGTLPSPTNNIDRPSHYTAYPLEVIEIIKLILDEIDRRELPLSGYQKACFKDEIKYRLRAGLKGDAAEDIGKAMKYMEFRTGVERNDD